MDSTISSSRSIIGEDVLGIIDYYQAIFERKGLSTRESEFRMFKLGLIVDLIKTTEMPEDLTRNLTSSIISAWRLSIPGKTVDEIMDEKGLILRSTEVMRKAVLWVRDHPNLALKKQLDAAIQFALPLRPADLRPEDIHKVHNLLNLAMEYIAATKEGGLAPSLS